MNNIGAFETEPHRMMSMVDYITRSTIISREYIKYFEISTKSKHKPSTYVNHVYTHLNLYDKT